jgi:hypothetical protein
LGFSSVVIPDIIGYETADGSEGWHPRTG